VAIQIMEHEVREIMKPQASIHGAMRQFITIGRIYKKQRKGTYDKRFLFVIISAFLKHSLSLSAIEQARNEICPCGQAKSLRGEIFASQM